MDIQFNEVSPNHGVVSITLNESDYKSAVAKQLRYYGQNVHLKGFRLGCAPIDLIKKMYGEAILAEELNKIATAALKNYIAQEHIPVFIEPLPVTPQQEMDLQNQRIFTFSYEIGFIDPAAIELGPHISVTEFQINSVGSKLVDEFLEGLQIVHGEAFEVKKSGSNLIVYGLLQDDAGTIALDLRISVAHLPDHLQPILVGCSVGERVVLTEEMLVNHFSARLGISFSSFAYLKKNKSIWPCTFTISKIVHVIPAPIDIKLFDLVLGEGKADSEASFRKVIADIILLDKRAEARYLFYEDLRDVLFKHISFDLPELFLKKWLMVHNTNATLKEVEDYYSAYASDLKWELLLGGIVRKNGLEVSSLDVVDEAKQMYTHYANNNLNISTVEHNDPRVHAGAIAFLKNNNGEYYGKLHEGLSRDRALNFIKNNISVVVETVTAEAFDARKLCCLHHELG